MKEMVTFLYDMDDKGIGVVAVENGLGTGWSSGRIMMRFIDALEVSNREVLIERTNSGLASTVANRTRLGPKKITNDRMTAKITEMHSTKKSIRAIASEAGVVTATVQRGLKKVG